MFLVLKIFKIEVKHLISNIFKIVTFPMTKPHSDGLDMLVDFGSGLDITL